MNIKKYFWTLPFLCFIGGYGISRFLFHTPSVAAPALIGKSLLAACTIASDLNLNIRLLEHKDNPDLPEGTVLLQIPSAGQSVKPRQTIFLSLSHQPQKKNVPNYLQKNKNEIEQSAKDNGIKVKFYAVPSNYPCNECIGQFPQPHTPLPTTPLCIYLSDGAIKPVIMPSFINRALEEVSDFLALYGIKPSIIGSYQGQYPLVIDQRPLAGTIINLDQNPTIQLSIQ